MLNPYINAVTLEHLLHWGPMIALVVLGLYLFWKSGYQSQPAPTAAAMNGQVADERSAERIRAEAELAKQHRLQDKQNLAREQHALSDVLPDWPIHELFSYINPNVLDRTEVDKSPWETVGNQIRDAFALDRLLVWGREVSPPGSLSDRHSVLREIEPGYWQSATFSYDFFDDTARGQRHTFITSGPSFLPEYTDLQVNRAQAEAIWPARH